ncbi:MAG: hypothetical protein ACE37I_03175 [Rubinisphaera brasiliensis]|uniref:5'-methylthioadenosine/S-adenosylhomocysteine nucleosidase family protein n=1 Tax=Rubinisphaera brasiliensis TaxID=119 RepID=UPI00391DFE67
MAIEWQDALRTLRKQFEAKASTSAGLYHLLIETSKDESDKFDGPTWFRHDLNPEFSDGKPVYKTWDWSYCSTLPEFSPSFREFHDGEEVRSIPEERIIRDASGMPRAVLVPGKDRMGYFCGPGFELREHFESLASMAASAIASTNDISHNPFAPQIQELFRRPRPCVRYVFGEVPEQPGRFISNGWKAGVMQFPHGVLIDLPLAEDFPGSGHWVLLLHQLGWQRSLGLGVRAARFAWEGRSEVDYGWLMQTRHAQKDDFADKFSRFSLESFYSVLGSKDAPDDLFLSSVLGIDQLLLCREDDMRTTIPNADDDVDYSHESWNTDTHPVIRPATKADCKTRPRIGLAVATDIELKSLLKRMQPPRGRRSILKVFVGDNTFYVGRLGLTDVVACMCAMGSGSRDASMAVTLDLIDQWNPDGLIMLGIAFGKERTRQCIGQVLVSDRIIPYEQQRVSESNPQERGAACLAGGVLLNRFRNVIGWSFRSPAGYECGYQVGALLSGEKLVDDEEFKRDIFNRHPIAIGGEMEGSGFAAAAERRRKEWIVAKAICDWADGTKSKNHQAFAAAASVHLVEHVLNQVGVLDDLSKT